MAKGEAEAPPDPDAAKHAYEKMKPALDAITTVKVGRAGLDQAALYVLRQVKELAAYRPRFALLPKELFNMAHFDELSAVALAAFYAQVQLDSATATASEVQVPLSIIDPADALKAEMMTVVVYHLAYRSARLKAEIDDIRLGSGYADLASDLSRLKTLYENDLHPLHADLKVFAAEDPHFHEGDAAEAGQRASQILDEMAKVRTVAEIAARDMAARAWTLLLSRWETIGSAAETVLGKQVAARIFGSLYAAGRAARRPGKKAAAPTKGAAPAGTAAGTAPAGGTKTG